MKVSGLSVNDILDMSWMDVQKLNRKDLAQLTSRLASAGNKRLRRLEKQGLEESPAYNAIARSGGDFSVKGKSLNELRAEYNRVRTFLDPSTKTSTVKGAKKVENEMRKRLGIEEDETMSTSQRKKFWKAYTLFLEKHKAEVFNIGSPTFMKLLRDIQKKDKRLSGDKLFKLMEDNINISQLYEEKMEQEDYYGKTRFLSIDDDDSEDELPFY